MNDAGFEFRRVLHVSGWSQSEVSVELGINCGCQSMDKARYTSGARSGYTEADRSAN